MRVKITLLIICVSFHKDIVTQVKGTQLSKYFLQVPSIQVSLRKTQGKVFSAKSFLSLNNV